MTTAYTSLLGLALPVQGELSGTWGDVVNNYLTQYVDAAVAGTQTLSTDADVTLTKTTGVPLTGTSSQYVIIRCTGARSVQRTITAPAASKFYIVINDTTGGFGVKLVGVGPTTGVVVPAGKRYLLAWNGSDFVAVISGPVNLTSDVTGTLPVVNGGTGITAFGTGVATALGQNVTGSGGIALATSPVFTTPNLGTPSAVNLSNATNLPLTTGVTGTLPVANGGTGVTTSTGSGSNVLSTSPVLTTPNLGTPSAVNLSNATSLPLSTGVTGTLPVGNGGTGVTTITGIIKGNGSSAFSAASAGTDYAPATSGTSILYGNGAGGFSNVSIGSGISFAGGTLSATGSGGTITSVTASSPLASSGGTTPNISFTGTLAVANGGTGSTTAVGARTNLDVPQTNGTGATGNWGINITGNAATVTNGVYQNQYGSFQSSFTSNIDANVNRNVGAYGSYSTGATNTPTNAGILLNFTSASDGSGDGLQIWSDFNNSNNLYQRRRWGGTYSSWGQILTASTYNSYAPSLTGTGASGTWGINITGNAANVTGTVAVANGGTGLTATPTNGQIDIGNGSGFTRATLTAGTGISITNGAGSITITNASLGAPTLNVVTGTTQSAVANNQYVLTNASATTVTLPGSPSAGDIVWVTVGNGRTDNVIARNGQNIMGLAENMTLNNQYAAVQLRFVDATRGWRMV